MMLLGMNSKRQRRPNVRLGEIGDFSAALCCVSSHRPKQNLEEIRCIDELENPNHSDFNPKSGYPMENSELVVLDPGFVQNQNDLSDKMHNLENWNPNSSKSVCEPPASNGTNAIKPNLDFGVITKKCRAMKRRGRSTMGYRRVSGRAWSSRVYPETSEKSNKEVCKDYSVNELEGTSDRKFSYTEKEDYENYFVEPDSDVQVGGGGDSDELLMIDSHKELPQTMNYDNDDEPCTGPESSVGIDKMGSSYKMGNGVSEWLDQLGFSKYIDMFEMHEVDEQVLPELTFDDLKEMGVNAVGSRRKIYNAIQLLKEENASI